MTEVEAGTRDLKGYDKIVGFVWLCKRLLSVRTRREANPRGVSVRKTSWLSSIGGGQVPLLFEKAGRI